MLKAPPHQRQNEEQTPAPVELGNWEAEELGKWEQVEHQLPPDG
jgi:hypothetical protein